jgi:hypothetical protein
MNDAFHFIGRCSAKGCKTTLRVTIPAKVETHTRNVNYYPGANNPPIYQTFQTSKPAWTPNNLSLFCGEHQRLISWRQVDGVLNPDHVCDARCTSARGHSCECSCGGANHGKAYEVAV